MATYPSILTKAEDAVYTAFNAIAGADLIDGVTVYKAGDQAEITLPAIIIEAVSAAPESEAVPAALSQNMVVTVEVSALSHGEETARTAHSNIAGLIEAVCFRSADLMPTEINAAAVANFTCNYYRPASLSRGMDETRRQTTATVVIGCLNK
jgi:hypothetical protein